MNKVLAQRLNVPGAAQFVPVGGKEVDGGHSQQEVCVGRNGMANGDGVALHLAVTAAAAGSVGLDVDGVLFSVTLAGLDEKQLGFSSQRGAFGAIEGFGQLPDGDVDAVHAVHAVLFAVAEDAAHEAVYVTVVPAAQILHHRQHLVALTVVFYQHLKAEPLEHLLQAFCEDTQIT